jgi:Holliday junction resolvase RusA-like endonuclease
MEKQVIHGTCPSKSNTYKIIKIGNIYSLGKTPALKKYEKDFYIQCNVYRDKEIDGYFEFYMDVYYPNQRSDLDNSAKVVLDCLQKAKAIKNKKYHIDDLIAGKHIKYPLHKFKNKLFDSGYVPKVCGSCGFSEERITDGKMPLLIDFLDGNLNNRKLENIRPLCYNCFFLLVGERNVKNWYDENGMPDEEDIQE